MQSNNNILDFNWAMKMRQQEKGRTFEERYSVLNYKYVGDEVDKLNAAKDDNEKITNTLKWVSFKDQFFACIAIADKGFTSNNLSSNVESKTSPYIKGYEMTSSVPFDIRGSQNTKMEFYFGPIKHGKRTAQTLDTSQCKRYIHRSKFDAQSSICTIHQQYSCSSGKRSRHQQYY